MDYDFDVDDRAASQKYEFEKYDARTAIFDGFRTKIPQAQSPQQMAQGRMCYFHPDRPAVRAEAFAPMCEDCYYRYVDARKAHHAAKPKHVLNYTGGRPSGESGKWVVLNDGSVHTWDVDHAGSPHHFEYLNSLGHFPVRSWGDDVTNSRDMNIMGAGLFDSGAKELWAADTGRENEAQRRVLEHYSQYAPDPGNYNFESKVANLETKPWQPGNYGKFIIMPDDTVHHWSTTSGNELPEDGTPYHSDFMKSLGPEVAKDYYHDGDEEIGRYTPGWITPHGELETLSGHEHRLPLVVDAIHRTSPSDGRWDFKSFEPVAKIALYDFEGIEGQNDPKPHPDLPDQPQWQNTDRGEWDDPEEWRYAVHNDGHVQTWPDKTHYQYFLDTRQEPEDFKDFGAWENDDPDSDYGPGRWESYKKMRFYQLGPQGQPVGLRDFYRGLMGREAKTAEYDFEEPQEEITHKAVVTQDGTAHVWPQRYQDDDGRTNVPYDPQKALDTYGDVNAYGWSHWMHMNDEGLHPDDVAHYFDIYGDRISHEGTGQFVSLDVHNAEKAVRNVLNSRRAARKLGEHHVHKTEGERFEWEALAQFQSVNASDKKHSEWDFEHAEDERPIVVTHDGRAFVGEPAGYHQDVINENNLRDSDVAARLLHWRGEISDAKHGYVDPEHEHLALQAMQAVNPHRASQREQDFGELAAQRARVVHNPDTQSNEKHSGMRTWDGPVDPSQLEGGERIIVTRDGKWHTEVNHHHKIMQQLGIKQDDVVNMGGRSYGTAPSLWWLNPEEQNTREQWAFGSTEHYLTPSLKMPQQPATPNRSQSRIVEPSPSRLSSPPQFLPSQAHAKSDLKAPYAGLLSSLRPSRIKDDQIHSPLISEALIASDSEPVSLAPAHSDSLTINARSETISTPRVGSSIRERLKTACFECGHDYHGEDTQCECPCVQRTSAQGEQTDNRPSWQRMVRSESIRDPIDFLDGKFSNDLYYNSAWHEDEDRKRYQHGLCDSYALALMADHPHLRLGGAGDKWGPTHWFAHDDTHAYDSIGSHPLPYHGVDGQLPQMFLDQDPKFWGLPENGTPQDIDNARALLPTHHPELYRSHKHSFSDLGPPQVRVYDNPKDGDLRSKDRPWIYDRDAHTLHVGPTNFYHSDFSDGFLKPQGIDGYKSGIVHGRTGYMERLYMPERRMIYDALSNHGFVDEDNGWDFESANRSPTGSHTGAGPLKVLANNWEVVQGQTQPEDTRFGNDPDRLPFDHHPIIPDPENRKLYVGTPGTHHIDLASEFPHIAHGQRLVLHPDGVQWNIYNPYGITDPGITRALANHFGYKIKGGDSFDFESTAEHYSSDTNPARTYWDFESEPPNQPMRKFVFNEHSGEGAIGKSDNLNDENDYHHNIANENDIRAFTHAGVLMDDGTYEIYNKPTTDAIHEWLKNHHPEPKFQPGYDEGFKIAGVEGDEDAWEAYQQGYSNKGLAGKAMVYSDGSIHAWNTTGGWPHHGQMENVLAAQGVANHSARSYHSIDKNGLVIPEYDPHNDAKLIADHIGGAVMPAGYNFFSSTAPEVHEIRGGTPLTKDLEGWVDRRPIVYDTINNNILIGDYDITHHDLIDRARNRGFAVPLGGANRHHQDLAYHGWIGPNPEIDDMQGDMIANEDTSHEYGWYTDLKPEHAAAAAQALEHHFRATPEMEGFNFERFGSSWDVQKLDAPPDKIGLNILGNRIPILYSPSTLRAKGVHGIENVDPVHHDRLYIGQPGWTHGALEHALGDLKGGIAPHRGEYWPNSGQFDWLQARSLGDELPHGHDEVIQKLQEHFPNIKDMTKEEPFNFESAWGDVSQRDPDQFTPEWDYDAYSNHHPNDIKPHPWQPGIYGKGIIINGKPITWGIDNYGAPHHQDVMFYHDPTWNSKVQGYFHINPQGEVEAEGRTDRLDEFLAHDSRLKPHDGTWDFESHLGSHKHAYPHAGPLEAGKGLQVEEVAHPGGDFEEDYGRPFIYSPNHNKVWVGEPTALHWDMISHVPELSEQYGTYNSQPPPDQENHSYGRIYGTTNGDEDTFSQIRIFNAAPNQDAVNEALNTHFNKRFNIDSEDTFDFESKISSGMASDLFRCSNCGSYAMTEPVQYRGKWSQRCTKCNRSRDVDPNHPFIKALGQQTGYPSVLNDLNQGRPMNPFGAKTAALTRAPDLHTFTNPEGITGGYNHPLVYWPTTGEIRVGEPFQHHEELSEGDGKAVRALINQRGKIDWLYGEPSPLHHEEVISQLQQRYKIPFKRDDSWDFEHLGKLSGSAREQSDHAEGQSARPQYKGDIPEWEIVLHSESLPDAQDAQKGADKSHLASDQKSAQANDEGQDHIGAQQLGEEHVLGLQRDGWEKLRQHGAGALDAIDVDYHPGDGARDDECDLMKRKGAHSLRLAQPNAQHNLTDPIAQGDTKFFDHSWWQDLTDPKQLVPWKRGTEGKGILHTDGSITTWQDQKIHHQAVQQFLHPRKKTQAFLDHIDHDGAVVMNDTDQPQAWEQLRSKGFKPVSMENYGYDFGGDDDYIGLNG